tara:strand:+ start:153 stop:527 length:375 start_codon:yes stop_codon:yes gene_type:complete
LIPDWPGLAHLETSSGCSQAAKSDSDNQWTESFFTRTERFAADLHTAFVRKILDITERKREPRVSLDRKAHDLIGHQGPKETGFFLNAADFLCSPSIGFLFSAVMTTAALAASCCYGPENQSIA